MPINWKHQTDDQCRNGIHFKADFGHFDAVIGVDRTDVYKPVFLRFGTKEKKNYETVAVAKAAAEDELENYIKSLGK